MGLDELKREFGNTLTVQEVADVFRVTPRTIRKYAYLFGGVEVAPGQWRFSENRIRSQMNAHADQTTWRDALAG